MFIFGALAAGPPVTLWALQCKPKGPLIQQENTPGRNPRGGGPQSPSLGRWGRDSKGRANRNALPLGFLGGSGRPFFALKEWSPSNSFKSGPPEKKIGTDKFQFIAQMAKLTAAQWLSVKKPFYNMEPEIGKPRGLPIFFWRLLSSCGVVYLIKTQSNMALEDMRRWICGKWNALLTGKG